jgi:hypothetical protein
VTLYLRSDFGNARQGFIPRCRNIEIIPAPYGILRLKRRFDLSSRDFIDCLTRDHPAKSCGSSLSAS